MHQATNFSEANAANAILVLCEQLQSDAQTQKKCAEEKDCKGSKGNEKGAFI